jgi:glycine/D-amino acid oxidase-like deaminating enzyme
LVRFEEAAPKSIRPGRKRSIRKLFPEIGDFDLDYAWHGSIGMTDTHLPKFQRLEPQVLSISAYNGRGIAAGTVFGYLLAQLIMGEISEGGMLLSVTTIRVRRPCLKVHFVCTGIY